MFIQKLRDRWQASDSLLCVGLDPDPSRIPAPLRGEPRGIFEFNRAIIDATADLVCAFKPQIAHYSAYGAEEQLVATIEYIHRLDPTIPVILDAKRGDIGSTAEMYAREAFDRYDADAVTVNPYLGFDATEPFLRRADKGVLVLCRTSNEGAGEFQDLLVDDAPLYQRVARAAALDWNRNGNVLLVAGATRPAELRGLRAALPDVPILILGVGAQGASVSEAVESGQDSRGTGLIVSSSRAVTYASTGLDFAASARRVASSLKAEINRSRRRARD